ncbi:hypothetical protein LXL04_023943 [Taraxacum kok-saghyz]
MASSSFGYEPMIGGKGKCTAGGRMWCWKHNLSFSCYIPWSSLSSTLRDAFVLFPPVQDGSKRRVHLGLLEEEGIREKEIPDEKEIPARRSSSVPFIYRDTTMASSSTSSTTKRSRNKVPEVVKCGCQDVCLIKNRDKYCGFFKWVIDEGEEEDETNVGEQMELLSCLKTVIGLLFCILLLLMLLIVVLSVKF